MNVWNECLDVEVQIGQQRNALTAVKPSVQLEGQRISLLLLARLHIV